MQAWLHGTVVFVLASLTISQAMHAEAGPQRGKDVDLPAGVRAVWDLDKAYREATATRERICINGLWRFRPAGADEEPVPEPGTGWGYFKVPGRWPQGDEDQIIYAAEEWKDDLPELDVAWYMREITIPRQWRGRRIGLRVEWLNSYAKVFVDGSEAGTLIFPGGEADITEACTPGKTHRLALQVFARALNREGTGLRTPGQFGRSRGPRTMQNRGLVGDVFLTSSPAAARISHVKAETSFRKELLTVGATLEGLEKGTAYSLRAHVLDGADEVLVGDSPPFTTADLDEGRIEFSKAWPDPKLWDTDTPQNTYELAVELVGGGRTLDAYHPLRFGFKEFWIDGRDFYLNGSRIHLRAVPIDSAQMGAANACYEGARETMKRIRMQGFNTVYTHNYGCSPGSHTDFSGVLNAADDLGMLLCFSLPQMRSYDWSTESGVAAYRRHLAWYVAQAQNHLSVIMYAQNHNSLAHADDENPQRPPQPFPEGISASARQRLAETYERQLLLKELDGVHPVYNHSGPAQSLYTMNCYLNWTPMQERSEWWKCWAETGQQPLFLVEYGSPWIASYSTVRDWRSWGSYTFHQWYYPEWAAAIRGDAAYDMSLFEREYLRWEADRWRTGQPFDRTILALWQETHGDVPNIAGVFAEVIAQTWPYMRTLGLSGFNIWHSSASLYPSRNVLLALPTPAVDWDAVQRPGLSPDCLASLFRVGDMRNYGVFEAVRTWRSDWLLNARGRALVRYNSPLLAYIAGKPERFTERGHNYLPGQTVEKQIIVVNDSRRAVQCRCQWSVSLPDGPGEMETLHVEPGQNARALIRFELPESVQSGAYEIALKATFTTGEVQEDSFDIHVLRSGRGRGLRVVGRTALYDPKGETAKLLSRLGLPCESVGVDADLSDYDVLVIGKKALSVEGPAPDLSGVPEGLKVVVFEQTLDVVEKRLGFRAQEYGLRRVFTRVPRHPMLRGLSTDNLRDWHGEAALIPPAMDWDNPNSTPRVEWCGYEVTRPGRAGCYGNVSSVMVEKPSSGDFLPLVVGGFALQYSPLMLYREGRGMIVFCQMDVTGRTEDDPAAMRLAGNIMRYAERYTPAEGRRAVYAGEPEGLAHLKAAGANVTAYEGLPLHQGEVLVAGPGCVEQLSPHVAGIASWLRGGGRVLTLGLDGEEIWACLPVDVRTERKEHIASYFEPDDANTLLAGVGCSDLMIRDPQVLPLICDRAEIKGDGVLASAVDVDAVFCQLVPWRFDYEDLYNTKLAFRLSSFAVNRLLANMGVQFETPLLGNFAEPLDPLTEEPDEEFMRSLWIESGGKLQLLPRQWKGLALEGDQESPAGWQRAEFDDSDWRDVTVPGSWESQFDDLAEFDGTFLYRVKVNVPAEMAGRKVTLVLGSVSDEDYTHVNGEPVGSTTVETHGRRAGREERRYEVPAGLLKAGENVLTVQVENLRRDGGIMGFRTVQFRVKEALYGDRMRWLSGLYLDRPVETDDPYRFLRW